MTLDALILAVKEENLPKSLLESYFDSMNDLKSKFKRELGDLKKKRAIFVFEQRNRADKKVSHVDAKDAWHVTADGQREIEVVASLGALAPHLDGLRHKLYNSYS